MFAKDTSRRYTLRRCFGISLILLIFALIFAFFHLGNDVIQGTHASLFLDHRQQQGLENLDYSEVLHKALNWTLHARDIHWIVWIVKNLCFYFSP